MGGIRDLYSRFRHLIHEGAKFLVVGGIGTVVTFIVANALQKSVGEYGAVTIATVVATVITYLGNRYWSFRHRQGSGTARETSIFFVLNGIGLLIYYGCIWAIKDVAGLDSKLWYNFALVLGTGLGTLFRFWSYRKWVWVSPNHPGQEDPEANGPGALGPDDTAVMPAGPEQEQLSPVTASQARSPQATRPAGAHRRR